MRDTGDCRPGNRSTGTGRCEPCPGQKVNSLMTGYWGEITVKVVLSLFSKSQKDSADCSQLI